jgi:TldD protein
VIDEDLMESVLDAAMSQGASTLAEVRAETSAHRSVALKSGEVTSVIARKDAGMNVRIVLPSGIGFASSNGVSKTNGIELAKRAYKLAKNVKLKREVSISEEPPVRTAWEVRAEKPLFDQSVEDQVEYLRGIDSAVCKTKVKVGGRYLELRNYEVRESFANSDGSRISSILPRSRLDAFLVVTSKGESEQSIREFGGVGGWEVVEGWDLQKALPDEVHMLKKMIEKGKKVKPGKYDLICGPEVAGIAAHESCGHPMEADRILGREMSQAGKSFVKPEMLGTRVGSEYATVIDDPTIPGSYGYYAYDQEGVKARPRFLYKEGVMNEFLTNRETAGSLGTPSNASSRSETYLKEPIVRMGNTHVAPGDFEDDEIFGSIKEGVLMHSFTEWNIDDKRYNQKYVSREAYFISDGELGGPAKSCALEITTPGFWGAVDAVSKTVKYQAAECGKGDPVQSMAVFCGGPMMRLRGVMLK